MRSTLSVISLLFLVACQRETPAPAIPVASEPDVEANVPDARPQPLTAQSAGAIAVDAAPTGLCNLEGVGDSNFAGATLLVNTSAPVLLRGWVGLESSATAPSSAVIRFEAVADFTKAWEVTLPVGEGREDVAKAYALPGLSNSGFSGAVDLSALPADTYRVYLAMAGDNKRYFCDNGRSVQVTQ